MKTKNKIDLIGFVGRDPDITHRPDGSVLNVRFSVATTDRWTDGAGAKKERTASCSGTGQPSNWPHSFTLDPSSKSKARCTARPTKRTACAARAGKCGDPTTGFSIASRARRLRPHPPKAPTSSTLRASATTCLSERQAIPTSIIRLRKGAST